MDDAFIKSQLKALADIAQPPPVSYLPQTWGWAVLLLLGGAWFARSRYRRWRANRYRRAALAEIDDLARQFRERIADFPIEAALPGLLKRTALAAWPRGDIASLSGDAWVSFLSERAQGQRLDDAFSRFVREGAYRPDGEAGANPLMLLRAARASFHPTGSKPLRSAFRFSAK